jgi:hypothetical protein
MKLRDVIAVLLGLKTPVLVPVPKDNKSKKR